jgi:hypothetical protein
MRWILATLALFAGAIFFDFISWEVALGTLAMALVIPLIQTVQRIDSNLQTLVERGNK